MSGGFDGQYAGDLRGAAIFQHANGDQYVHPEPGDCGRVLPDWHTVLDCHDAHEAVGVWWCHVQSLHGEHVDYAVHFVHISVHHVRGPVHRHLPPHLVAQVPNSAGVPRGVRSGLAGVSHYHATDNDIR